MFGGNTKYDQSFAKNYISLFSLNRHWAAAARVRSPEELPGSRGHRLKTAGLWSWFPELLSRGGSGGVHTMVQLLEVLRYKPVRFPMVALEFFIDIIRLSALSPWGRLSL